MKPHKTAALLGALVLTVAPTLASAQAAPQACAARDKVVERLNSAYGEKIQSMGLGANNGVVEVFASEETGTWTITVTMPDGQTCLIASGQAFESMEGMPMLPTGNDA